MNRKRKPKKLKKQGLSDIKERYTKTGDKELNRYTDAVVEDIRNKLHTEFPVDIYGGSAFIDWLRLDGLGTLKFPNILVHTDSNYTFANKSYTRY